MSDKPQVNPDAEGQPMRLLYVVQGFPPDTWAGTEVYTMELALQMQRLGHQVTVITRTPPVADEPDWSLHETQFGGLNVLRITRRVDGLPIGESYRPAGAREVFEGLLDRFNPDIVHFQHLLHLSVEWIAVAKERGLPTVYTANDYWTVCARVQLQQPDGALCEQNQGHGCFPCIKDKPVTWIPHARRLFPLVDGLVSGLDKLAGKGGRLARFTQSWIGLRERQPYVLTQFGSVDLTLAPSQFLRGVLLRSGGFDPERILHSDYGMGAPDEEIEVAERANSDPIRFGFIGSLVEYKGIAVLLRAMNMLTAESCTLGVFGDFQPSTDPYHGEMERLATGGQVTFHGRFDNEKLREVYEGIDVLVVPSTWYENSPLVIHEAFLHKTPVITSDIGGMAELVTDGTNGLHFRASDDRSLAEAMARFVREPELLGQLSKAFPRYKTPAEDAAEIEQHYRRLSR